MGAKIWCTRVAWLHPQVSLRLVVLLFGYCIGLGANVNSLGAMICAAWSSAAS